MKRVTIRNVAELAKVDFSTVSRILNSSFDNHKYADATIKRVKEAAEKLGYYPSAPARAIRTGKTMLLGLIVADIGNPFFSVIASHLDNIIRDSNYSLVISSTNENPLRQEEHIDSMLSHRVDGLIIAPCGDNGFEKAYKTGVPLVTIDRPLPDSGLPFVGLDNIAAGRLLAEKLNNYGYKSIGVVIPDQENDLTIQSRLKGLRSGLKGTDLSIQWIVKVPHTSIKRNEVKSVLDDKFKNIDSFPDAMVGMTNVCTIGILEALGDLNYNSKISPGLAGIDDFTGAHIVRPSVSVVSQPLEKIASESISLLKEIMSSGRNWVKNKNIRISPLWIERMSLPPRK